jgi:hypothetical protein
LGEGNGFLGILKGCVTQLRLSTSRTSLVLVVFFSKGGAIISTGQVVDVQFQKRAAGPHGRQHDVVIHWCGEPAHVYSSCRSRDCKMQSFGQELQMPVVFLSQW